jgi:membrane protease subunit HflC
MSRKNMILIALGVLILVILPSTFYTLDETEQAIITQFGRPVGGAKTSPGLYFKVPFIQDVHRFDKRWMAWDGDANQITTKDKKFIWVDAYARWRIADPLKFFQSVRDERGGQSRLDDIIDGETRNAVELARVILEQASKVTPNFGIELVDVQFKRINYVEDVRTKVYERMISERQRIAERSRSEGQGRAAEIRGQKERELNTIESEAYKTAEEIRGRADAAATAIYAAAYNKDPAFYQFMKTLETYRSSLDENVTLILSSDSDFLKFLKRANPR